MSATDNSSAFALADDFSRRQILPASAAVKAPRFSTTRHWAVAAQIREVLDLDAPPPPRPVASQQCESIIMEGASIRRTMRTGAFEVRQNSTVALDVDNTPPPLAFEPVADSTLQSDAAAALAAINSRARRAPRAAAVPKPPSKGTSLAVLAVVLALAALTVCALVSVIRSAL